MIEWTKVILDRSITNPLDLSFAEYFQQSAWKQIPEEYRTSLKSAGDILYDIETFGEITGRIFRELRRLQRANVGKNHHILIFTHQCNTDLITQILNSYVYGGLNTGENITLEKTHAPDGTIDFRVIDFPQGITSSFWSQEVIQQIQKRFKNVAT